MIESKNIFIDDLNDVYKYFPDFEIKRHSDWNRLTVKFPLTERFILRYLKFLDFTYIFANQDVSKTFFERNKSKVNWYSLSSFISPDKDLSLLKEKIIWSVYLNKFKSISPSRVLSLFDDLSKAPWPELCLLSAFTTDELRKYDKYLSWNSVSEKQALDEEFIRDYKNKISWLILPSNKNIKLTYPFIVEHINYLDPIRFLPLLSGNDYFQFKEYVDLRNNFL